MDFCTTFDALLAESGAPAIFLPDREGLLRFDAEWTRGAWGRAEVEPVREPAWVLLRDRDTGFVLLAFTSSRALLVEHPRMDCRAFTALDEALAQRSSFGDPPICREPW